MKKIIVEIAPKKEILELSENIFEKIKKMEILEVFHLDLDNSIKIIMALIKTKDDTPIEKIIMPDGAKLLDILKSEGNNHICILRGERPDLKALFEKFNLELIWDAPMILSKDKFVYSVIGDSENIKGFLEAITCLGKIDKVSFQTPTYKLHGLLTCLTNKQREIMILAKKNGYYEYPRRINGDDLARIIGISKASTIEHLRKAESRLINKITVGY